MSGVFITIEGPDGAGKTTLINALVPQLNVLYKLPVLVTREPGGNDIAEKIRQLILDPTHTTMDARTEALLYAASRRQHLVATVLPALENGQCVICDRFVDSSVAYQGHARGIGVEGVWSINQFAIQDTMPDLTFYVSISAQEGLRRIHEQRTDEINRLDLETQEFHQKVVEGYETIAMQNTERIVVLDGMQSPDRIVSQALEIMLTRFPELLK